MTAALEPEVITAEVLPPDVETKVVALRHLDGSAQAAAVTVMLSHSRTGLLAAIAAQDLPEIVEWKAKGAAIQEVAKQLRLGKDMQLDAAEFVRRAERGLGVAIREGQLRGEVKTRGDGGYPSHATCPSGGQVDGKPSPTDFASKGELSGSSPAKPGIYALADGVSDEQFEEAITEAKAEGNLSRANVARKAQSKVAVDTDDPLIDADVQPPLARPFKKTDLEMLAHIEGTLRDLADFITWVDPALVPKDEAERLTRSARSAVRAIASTLTEIRKASDG